MRHTLNTKLAGWLYYPVNHGSVKSENEGLCPSTFTQVNDNLRELLLCDDSDNAELYNDNEKSELLWRLFEHMCLGGPCCQNEVS
jgi:hypothetical protein